MNDLALNKHQNLVKYERDHFLSPDFTKPQTVTTTLYQIAFQKSKFGYCDQGCELELKKLDRNAKLELKQNKTW